MFVFTSGPFGGVSERRRLPGCHSFVPVVRKQAEAALLHLTVPLQLTCLTEQHDSRPRLGFVLLQSVTSSSVGVREACVKCYKK